MRRSSSSLPLPCSQRADEQNRRTDGENQVARQERQAPEQIDDLADQRCRAQHEHENGRGGITVFDPVGVPVFQRLTGVKKADANACQQAEGPGGRREGQRHIQGVAGNRDRQ